MKRLLTLLGALVLFVGVPALTLYTLGQLQASPAGYALGVLLGLALMALLAAALSRVADPFVLEVSITVAFGAGLLFAAWLALRNR